MSRSAPVTDLSTPQARADLVVRLSAPYVGRPVLVGPGILAGFTDVVARLVDLGCPVMVLSTSRGAGPVPPEGSCEVVEVSLPPTASMTEEVRVLDRVVRDLPPDVVAAIDAFDPERRGWWHTTPFVTNDEPVLGRRVRGGRPASYLALEDKMLADDVWAAAGVPHAAHRVVATDAAALAAASDELATPQGVVWSGDARDGLNGGGNFVRWVATPDDRAEAFAFFAPRCDRVRVMPFLDGVPCSIHGIVLPPEDAGTGTCTAVFRPVELAILRRPEARDFCYGGLSTWWDPSPDDREQMRDVARRVGDLLAVEHDYRGAFGIDGVLTADGFRPTELNPRFSAGVTTLARVDPWLLTLLQATLAVGDDPGVTVAGLESLVPLMDAERVGRPIWVGQGTAVGEHEVDVRLADDGRLERADAPTGSRLETADTPVGYFARIDPCTLLGPGDRLAPLNAALTDFLDRELGASIGPLEPAPDLRPAPAAADDV